jgi:hypothetical protein
MDQGGFAAFAKGSDAVMVASSIDSFGNTIATNEVRYRAVFQMAADDKMVGKPLRELGNAEYLQIEFAAMDENQPIKNGQAIVVLNGGLRLEFDVPPQRSQGRRVFIRGIQEKVRTLLQ